MESKKINQLATNVAPLSTDLTIIGDPSTGVSKKVTLSQIANLFAGSIDFYANLAAFPATGTINIIYCAKDTQKLYLWSGSAYVETFPSQAVLNTYQLLSAKGVANGYASLDSAGKVPIAQLPSSIMEYKGLWSAATNTPTLANGTGDTGDVYICSAAGSVNFGAGAITFAVGDYVIYSGSIWQRSSGAVGTVTSVGLSSATSGVTIGSSPITTSGTITLAIATATTSQNGLLSSVDWATFNGKESVLTFSSPLVRTTNTISIPAATTSVNGYLASADFTTFNNKQNAITLTTTGTSGASTLVGATLNIPNYGSALTGYVPYTGATQDVDLGAFKLNAQSLHAKGTAGNGHLGLKHQSASATASANEVSLFADSLGDLSWQNGNLYLSKFITSGNTAARSYTFPNANGTIALTSDISYPVTSVFGRTGAVVATSGDYTTAQVTESGNLYFTDSRARLALSFVAGSGAYNSTTGVITIPTNNNQITNGAGYTTNVGTVTSVAATGGTGISITGSPITTSGTITITNTAPDQTVALTASTGISVTGTYPNFTITNTSPSSGGTVTSVAALTIGTSGTDLSSTVATSTTTPVITLNVPTASAANRGALSSADWTTFNNKQSALTNPVTGTGTTNYLPKFTGASTIGNSIISESGGAISVAGNIQTDGNANRYVKSTGFISNQLGQLSDFGVSDAGYYFVAGGGIQFVSGGANRMLLTSSGNLGLGVTPSAWSGVNALQVVAACLSSNTATSGMFLSANAFFDGSTDRYINTKQATRYYQLEGNHVWQIAPSGTAGNAITFTQAMTLTAAGSLGLGIATPSTLLHIASSSASFFTIDAGTSSNSGISFYRAGSPFGAIYYLSTNTMRFDVNNAIAMLIDSNANTSIGYTTNPSLYKLDVNGTGRFSVSSTSQNQLRVYSTDGTATLKSYSTSDGDGLILNQYYAVAGNPYLRSADFVASMGDVSSTQMRFFTKAYASNPAVALTIASTGAATFSAATSGNTVTINGTAGSFATRVNGSSTTGSSYGIGIFAGTNSSDDSFRVHNYSGTEYFRVRGDGNVGIGTTSPTGLLHLYGADPAFRIQSSTTGNMQFGQWDGTNNRIQASGRDFLLTVQDSYNMLFNTNATERMRITSGGQVGIGVTPSAWSSATFPNVLQVGYASLITNGGAFAQLSSNLYYDGTAYKYISTNGASRIILDSDGAITFNNAASGTSGTTVTTSERLRISNTGAATFSSSVTATSFFESSDSRLKTLIQDNYQTKGIASITPKLYTKNGKVELGYYAQDFIGILDSAVSKGSDDMLSLSYREVLVAKVYALEQRIKELENK